MIKNASVKKLKIVRSIYIAFFALGLFSSIVISITSLVANSKDVSVNQMVGLIIGFVLGVAIIGVLGYLILCLIDYFINKRQENIDYMNARLEHLNSKSNKKEAK